MWWPGAPSWLGGAGQFVEQPLIEVGGVDHRPTGHALFGAAAIAAQRRRC